MNADRPALSSALKREYRAKVVLTLLFLGGLGGLLTLSFNLGRLQEIASWGALDLLLLALSVFRLGRLVAYDRVMEPFRRPFAQTVPDSTGAGESVEPIGEGLRQAFGQLVTCPICAGTWIAAILVLFRIWFPLIALAFLWMTAAVALAEVINSVVEVWCWGGQLSRVKAGALMREQQDRRS